jgi:ketosteroid isomerase-like protein
MDREGAQRWLDRYVAAWRSYDRDEVSGLFAEDVAYRYHPYDEPVTGRDADGRCREFTEYYIKQPTSLVTEGNPT